MGLFDEVIIQYPLPAELAEYQNDVYQTKDFDCALLEYVITAEGELIRKNYEYRDLTQEEKDSYNNKFFTPIMTRTGKVTEVTLKPHGDYRIYNKKELFVRFTHGRLEEIREWRDEDNVFTEYMF